MGYEDQIDELGVNGVGGFVGEVMKGFFEDDKINKEREGEKIGKKLLGEEIKIIYKEIEKVIII